MESSLSETNDVPLSINPGSPLKISTSERQQDGKFSVDRTQKSKSAASMDSSTESTPIMQGTPGKNGTRGNWTEGEDEKLRRAVAEYSGKNWKKIADQIPDRSDVQCLHRWQKVLRPGLIKGPWTPEVSCM